MNIVTLALATRLKRRVFTSKGIQAHAESLIKSIMSELDAEIRMMEFLDYGLIITLENKNELSAEEIATYIRVNTSRRLRESYTELYSMPSFWTRRCYSQSGEITDQMRDEIQKYFSGIKSR